MGAATDKAELAHKLGAQDYIDTSAFNGAQELSKMGGAKIVLATAPSSKAMSELVDGIAAGGKLVIVGADTDPLAVSPAQLISRRRSIVGWPSGTSRDSEDALTFAAQTGVRPMIETFPLDRAAEAYQRMISGTVRFRAVLTI